MTPSHYLNQWCSIVNWTVWNKHRWNFNSNLNIFVQENAFENVVCEMASIVCRPQCVNTIPFFFIMLWGSFTGTEAMAWLIVLFLSLGQGCSTQIYGLVQEREALLYNTFSQWLSPYPAWSLPHAVTDEANSAGCGWKWPVSINIKTDKARTECIFPGM